MCTKIDGSPIVWARRRYVVHRFSLPWRQLNSLVNRRLVRALRMGHHPQSRLLYHVPDVEAALKAQAEGQAAHVQEDGVGVETRG